MTRSTHTYAELEVSAEVYDEIAGKLKAVGYDHAFMEGGAIDMHGIGLTRVASKAPEARPFILEWPKEAETEAEVYSNRYALGDHIRFAGYSWLVAAVSQDDNRGAGVDVLTLSREGAPPIRVVQWDMRIGPPLPSSSPRQEP